MQVSESERERVAGLSFHGPTYKLSDLRLNIVTFHIKLLNYGTLFRTHLEPLLLRTSSERYYNTTLFSSIATRL